MTDRREVFVLTCVSIHNGVCMLVNILNINILGEKDKECCCTNLFLEKFTTEFETKKRMAPF